MMVTSNTILIYVQVDHRKQRLCVIPGKKRIGVIVCMLASSAVDRRLAEKQQIPIL
jgi:hypothetical protein